MNTKNVDNMKKFIKFFTSLFSSDIVSKWVTGLNTEVCNTVRNKVPKFIEETAISTKKIAEVSTSASISVANPSPQKTKSSTAQFTDEINMEEQRAGNMRNLRKKRVPDKNKKVRQVQKMDEITTGIHLFLTSHFELRYNVITEQTEYRPIGARMNQFKPINQRQVNTLCIEIRKEGIDCWDRDLMRYLNSAFVAEYHPFRMYMDELPEWDGQDRLDDLALRVSTSTYWVKYFHRWMLGMTAQWLGMEQLHANSVAPLLISQQQGWQKSTFCRSLIPAPLQGYYTDQLNLASSTAEIQLSLMGLINLDEFDRISPKKMAQLKNLMQLSSLNIRKAYKKNYQHLPRIASFIGTSNRKDLLTDPTGSRRFICVEVEGPINCMNLDMNQIYAQLKNELQAGERFWFIHEEEQEIQEHNRSFYQLMPEEEIFQAHFRIPKNDEAFELLSLAQILEILREYHKGLMYHFNLGRFGSALVASGVERIHTYEGNRYKVVRLQK